MTAAEPHVRLLALVSGSVQGVGFRWWTRSRARELALVGHARNLRDGRVEVSAQGSRAACERLLELLGEPAEDAARDARFPARPGRVDVVTSTWLPAAEAPEAPETFVER